MFCEGWRRLRGRLRLEVWRGHELVDVDDGSNLTLAGADALVARALSGDASAQLTAVRVGTDPTPPAPEQTGALGDWVSVPAQLVVTGGQLQVQFEVGEAQANELGALAEFVLVAADGTAFARRARSPLPKTADTTIRGTWLLESQ